MLSIAILTVVRVLHIICAVFWVMASTILTLFVRPILSGDPAGHASLERILRRWGMSILLGTASPLAMITGIYLFMVQRDFAMNGLDQIVLGGGAVAGLAGFIWGIAVILPAGMRMQRVAKHIEATDDPAAVAELARLEGGEHRAHYTMIILQWVALVAMSAFRYL